MLQWKLAKANAKQLRKEVVQKVWAKKLFTQKYKTLFRGAKKLSKELL